MKASKELVQHISTRFWDKSNKEVAQCLSDFKGEWFESESAVFPTKKNLDIEQTKQRDWTGVRFRYKYSLDVFTLSKNFEGNYTWGTKKDYVSSDYVIGNFTGGIWIELPPEQETPIIHVQKPNILEERIKRIEQHLKL